MATRLAPNDHDTVLAVVKQCKATKEQISQVFPGIPATSLPKGLFQVLSMMEAVVNDSLLILEKLSRLPEKRQSQEMRRKVMKEYKEKNEEAVKKKKKEYYLANKEKLAAYNKAYIQANRERIREANMLRNRRLRLKARQERRLLVSGGEAPNRS